MRKKQCKALILNWGGGAAPSPDPSPNFYSELIVIAKRACIN